MKTIVWESDGTNLQFYTNDSSDFSSSYFVHSYDKYDLQVDSITAYIKKNSGSQDFGYGMIFGRQDGDNYYRMNVTTDGYCKVYKVINGSSETLIDWTQMSANMAYKTGYNVENKVNIWESTTTDNKFWIVFNDSSYGYSFTDSGTVFNSGYVGFIASVGSSDYESFPNHPVDVRCRLVSPVSMRSIPFMNASSELVRQEDINN